MKYALLLFLLAACTPVAQTSETYGVISDIHGEVEKARSFAQHFNEQGVRAIILPGDMVDHETLRTRTVDDNDYEELKEVLIAVAETGLPVLVIPGNHERRLVYEQVMKEVQATYTNVIDMTQQRVYDDTYVDFVSIPGYQFNKTATHKFMADDGYWATPQFIQETAAHVDEANSPVVLITHGPPYTGSKPGPGTIISGEDVGDETTATFMRDNAIPFALVGHIHEAGGLAATLDGTFVPQRTWVEAGVMNFGTLLRWKLNSGGYTEGMAGLFETNGTHARYHMIEYNLR